MEIFPESESDVTYGQVWWPILGISALHLPIQSAHTQQWTHILYIHSFPPPKIPAGPRLELTTFRIRVQLSNH